MLSAQLEKGLAYAEDNFRNPDAPHLRIDKQVVQEWLDLKGKKILDFGCGMGGMTLWYAKKGADQVTGLDIDSHHIAIAEKLRQKYQMSQVRFLRQNILEKALDERFDLIFLNDVVEHIPLPELGLILGVLKKSLNPGGKLFVAYPPWQSPYASHLNGVIRIPWCQFLPPVLLNYLIDRYNQPITGELESDLKSAYQGLNHLTHRKLLPLLRKNSLQLEIRKSHCILNRWKPIRNFRFSFFPFNFLITKEFLLLEPECKV